MNIIVLTIFPELFDGFRSTGLFGKAVEKELLSFDAINIRDFAEPPHYHVDDAPYGGGPGMVMKPEPLAKAIRCAKKKLPEATCIALTAAGKTFQQSDARRLSANDLILLCGRYEGIDQRLIDSLVDEEISIGDYVLMGGEIPAMAVLEATSRLLPGVLGNPDSIDCESFSEKLPQGAILESPQYTRPADFEGAKVPEVLLSGDHKRIQEWRKEQSLERTRRREEP